MSTRIKYDEVSDTLAVTFETAVLATGIELTDHILLRIDRQAGKAISLVLLDYSILAQNTSVGRRSFPLTGLSDLSRELQNVVFDILRQKPVSDFLQVSAYTPNLTTITPIVSVNSYHSTVTS